MLKPYSGPTEMPRDRAVRMLSGILAGAVRGGVTGAQWTDAETSEVRMIVDDIIEAANLERTSDHAKAVDALIKGDQR